MNALVSPAEPTAQPQQGEPLLRSLALCDLVDSTSLVERLGNETIVNIELASGTPWLAVLDGDQALRIGESLALTAEPAKAILFDRNGKSLLAPAD